MAALTPWRRRDRGAGAGARPRPPPHGRRPSHARTCVSQTRYAFQASAIRTRPRRRPAEVLGMTGILISVPNRPSQQVRREWAVGEPNSAVVPFLPVNRSGGKPWPNLGFSCRLAEAESLTSAKTGGGGATRYKRSLGWSLGERNPASDLAERTHGGPWQVSLRPANLHPSAKVALRMRP